MQSEHGAERAPILVERKTGSCKAKDDQVVLIGLNCRCGSVWCPKCFKTYRAPEISERLRAFDWTSTRQIVLTVDPANFESGQSAHEHVTQKKLIPQLIHNLKRTKGTRVKDYLWCLEWHRNGFPHWHLFIDVVEKGKEGMIGGDNIRQYWAIGAVRESPIRNRHHWDQFTDYFQNKGYFEKQKAHQAKLPEWALKSRKRIRRCDSMRKIREVSIPDTIEDISGENLEKEVGSNGDAQEEMTKTYEMTLSQCGMKTTCKILWNGQETWRVFNIPYQVFKSLPGEYVPGKGFIIRFSFHDFLLFRALWEEPDSEEQTMLEALPDRWV